ncbi:MAG TPA: diguanylate cyclase [Acidimicrobiales bacterium]|nr:diguanylate cyclase [Acidimicrobiales bacterium]
MLLEAAGDVSGPPLDTERLRQLSEVLDCDQVVALQDQHRYAVQLLVASASPAEALFAASARWSDAQRRLGLTRFHLKRAEVLSPDEYERECAAAPGARPADRRPLGPEGDELLRRVFHDSLTGLPSLAFFRDRAQGIVSSGALTGRPMVLVVLDVDGFATVNDELGYVFGDEILVTLARRLSSLADPGWALSRLAGDEFVVLVDVGPDGADAVARLILDTVREPISINRRAVAVTASLGLVPVRFDSDLDECLGRAGAAMCAAKEAGGDGYRWYELGLATDRRRLDFVGPHLPARLAYILLLERAALAANECSSLEEAAAVVLHQVLAHTGWRAGRLWRVDDEGGGLVPTGVWYAAGSDRPEPQVPAAGGGAPAADAGLPGRVLASGRPEWVSATGADDSAPGQPAPGAAATVAFPVLAGREVVAVLEFFSARPIAPDDSLLEVMAAVGAQLGRIFERTRAAAALARSEERYRGLADSLPALIWAAGPDARCTFVNRAWLEFTGRPMEAELGDGWAVGVHPDDLGASIRAYLPAFAQRRPFEIEFRMRRHDGQYRWLLSRGAPVFDNAVFGGFVGSCFDITDRRQAEAHQVSDRRSLSRQ